LVCSGINSILFVFIVEEGFKTKTLLVSQEVIKAVEKYAKQRNTTQRVVWDEVLKAGVAALNLQK